MLKVFYKTKTILRYQTSDTPMPVFKRMSPKIFGGIIIHGTEGYARSMFGADFVGLPNVISLPNPVDTQKFSPEGKVPAKSDIFGVPDDAFVFLSVSFIEPRKGVKELVTAFSEMNLDNVYLVHVGDCAGHQDYEAIVKSCANTNARFLGRRSDIPELMRAADVFVLYSEYEGMPYVVVEAMASGLHVVASNAGSNEEVLKGVGTVVEWGDGCSLKKAMGSALNDLLANRKIGEAARDRVIQKYSVSSYFSALQDVYGTARQ